MGIAVKARSLLGSEFPLGLLLHLQFEQRAAAIADFARSGSTYLLTTTYTATTKNSDIATADASDCGGLRIFENGQCAESRPSTVQVTCVTTIGRPLCLRSKPAWNQRPGSSSAWPFSAAGSC